MLQKNHHRFALHEPSKEKRCKCLGWNTANNTYTGPPCGYRWMVIYWYILYLLYYMFQKIHKPETLKRCKQIPPAKKPWQTCDLFLKGKLFDLQIQLVIGRKIGWLESNRVKNWLTGSSKKQQILVFQTLVWRNIWLLEVTYIHLRRKCVLVKNIEY